MDRDIKFGFWNYVESGVYGVEAVDQWKDLRCNLPMSFTFDINKHKKEDMIAVLDKCQEYGMKLVLRDERTSFRTFQRLGKEEFKKGVLNAYNDFGKHPATFGFFVGDEPGVTEYDDYIAILVIFFPPTVTTIRIFHLIKLVGIVRKDIVADFDNYKAWF